MSPMSSSPDEVGRKAALLTGAAGGLGRAVASALAAEGLAVAVCDANDTVHQLAETLRDDGAEVLGITCDVTDAQAAELAYRQATEALGPVTVVVTAAAIVDQVERSWKFTADMWQREIDVNLTGTFNAIRPALPVLRSSGGRIVPISSVGAEMGFSGQVAYSASKAGILGMIRSLAQELGSSGTTVNAVLPGVIATPKVEAMPAAVKARLEQNIPLHRFAAANEIAALVAFLVSDRAAYITGSSLVIDGGLGLGTITLGTR